MGTLGVTVGGATGTGNVVVGADEFVIIGACGCGRAMVVVDTVLVVGGWPGTPPVNGPPPPLGAGIADW